MDWFKWFRRRPAPVVPDGPPSSLPLPPGASRALENWAKAGYPPIVGKKAEWKLDQAPAPLQAPVTLQAPTPPPADKTPKSLTTADGTVRVVLQRFPAQHRAVLLPLALAIVEADRTVPAAMVQRVVLDTLAALASRKRQAGGCCGGKCKRTSTKRENPPAQQ